MGMCLYHITAYKANANWFLWCYRQSLTAVALEMKRERARGGGERQREGDSDRGGRQKETAGGRWAFVLTEAPCSRKLRWFLFLFLFNITVFYHTSHSGTCLGIGFSCTWPIDRGSLSDWRFADLQKHPGVCHELRQPGQCLRTSAPWTATASPPEVSSGS